MICYSSFLENVNLSLQYSLNIRANRSTVALKNSYSFILGDMEQPKQTWCTHMNNILELAIRFNQIYLSKVYDSDPVKPKQAYRKKQLLLRPK